MRIDALRIEGLRHADEWHGDGLGAFVVLPQAPAGVAVADAIALFAAALDADRTASIAARIGLCAPMREVLRDAGGLPEQIDGLDPEEVDAALDPDAGRRVSVTARLALDPPLFGRLRDESMRDPRMLAALGSDPSVTVKVGWLFTTDRTTASIGVLEVKVADTPFPTGRTERPRWMDGLLIQIGRRLGGVGSDTDLESMGTWLADAAMSPDPGVRARYARLASALAEPPFSLGRLELVQQEHRISPCFGERLVRARQLGPRALRALRVARAALVEAPDVLVVEDDAAAPWAGWLQECTDGDGATLEQVFALPPGNG